MRLELSTSALRCVMSLISRQMGGFHPSLASFPPSTPRIFGDVKQQQLNKSKLWEKFPMCCRIFPSLDNNKYKSPSKQVEKMHPYASMVSSSFGLCFIFFTLVIVSSFSFSEIHAQGYHPYQREFDYFALALQWPGTYCQKTKYCCPTNGCCRGSDSSIHFTIHGLWPDYNDGTWPACCTKSRFDEKEISSLLGALQEYWPSLSCGQTSTCSSGRGLFWAHEWEKHGTCSSPVFRDEYNYFLATLNLYFKYNITEVLSEAGIVPSYSEKYPLGAVVSAIENAVGASPLLVCSNGNVQELRICFYKDFKPRDCIIDSTGQNHDLASRSSCPRYVGLPKFTPLELDNQEEAALPL